MKRVPQEVKRLRREVMDFSRKLGQPVMLKHQLGNEDLVQGNAVHCPACWDTEYGNVRNMCRVCFGIGFVGAVDGVMVPDDITNLFLSEGNLVNSQTLQRAPRYGGYGQGNITYMVQPDTPVDVFRINEHGVMVQTQNANGVAPWFPTLHDNDLVINALFTPTLGPEEILSYGASLPQFAYERYQLKLTNPVTVRGFGSRAINQDYQVQQTFAMAHVPKNNILYFVPTDR